MTDDERHSEQSISHHEYFRYSHGTIIAKRRDTLQCRHHRNWREIERLFGHHAHTIHTHTVSQNQTLINSRPNSVQVHRNSTNNGARLRNWFEEDRTKWLIKLNWTSAQHAALWTELSCSLSLAENVCVNDLNVCFWIASPMYGAELKRFASEIRIGRRCLVPLEA